MADALVGNVMVDREHPTNSCIVTDREVFLKQVDSWSCRFESCRPH